VDKLDTEIINLMQVDFPLNSRPYLTLAQKLGISENKVICRIRDLKEMGYIRKLSCIFDSSKLGYISTLCAVKVPEESIEEVSSIINSYEGVTHNYIRNHSYNMWFTMIAASEKELNKHIEEIKYRIQISQFLNLNAIRLFKIKVNFRMKVE
jgi:DNA-binding Lrp family transcriptional regulator